MADFKRFVYVEKRKISAEEEVFVVDGDEKGAILVYEIEKVKEWFAQRDAKAGKLASGEAKIFGDIRLEIVPNTYST